MAHLFIYFTGISCVPTSQSAKAGDSISYNCSLRNIEKIMQIIIPELDYHMADENGINGEFAVDNDVTLIINLLARDEIVILFKNVNCAKEGKVTLDINDGISAVIMLRLIGT